MVGEKWGKKVATLFIERECCQFYYFFYFFFFFFATLLSVRHNEKLSPRLQVRKYIVDDDEDSKSARHLRRGQGGRNAAYIVNEFSQTESINVHNYYWYV